MLQLDTLTNLVNDVSGQVQLLSDRNAALTTAVQSAVAALSTGDQQGAIEALTGTVNQAKEHLAANIGVVTSNTQALTDAVTPPQP